MSIAEKLTTIAENEQRVYQAGKTAEYDRFWNGYQENGNRTNYAYAFSRRGWTDETYKPKYPVVLKGTNSDIYRESRITELSNIDTSKATGLNTAFYNSDLQTIDKLDFSNATITTNAFAHSVYLHTIGELVSSETTVWASNTFSTNTNLTNLTITGIIATDFTCSNAKLTYESLMSIINALKDFSAEGGTHTCTLGTANLKKLTDTEKAIATGKGWTLA